MIFGFNTDIKVGDTVYHLQTEARKADLLLETQVFLKGRCIGKHVTSYAEKASDSAINDEKIHELLKAQHKQLVDALRAGTIDALYTTAQAEIQDIDGSGLSVTWTNPQEATADSRIVMRFLVTDSGAAADSALLTSRLSLAGDAPIHSQTATEEDGTAELEIVLPATQSAETIVLISAKFGEKSATRKFRLKH